MTAFAALPVPALAATEIPRWLTLLTSISTVIIAVALVTTAISLAVIARAAWKQAKRTSALAGRAREALLPVLRHGEEIADNLNYVTTAFRQDVERFQGTIHAAQARMEVAARTTEKRINDFNALLAVVQEEAEQLFIGSASTLRGVRAGATTLRGLRRAEEWEEEVAAEEGAYRPQREP